MAEPNDLVLIFADNVTRCWKQIIYFGRDPAGAAASRPRHRRRALAAGRPAAARGSASCPRVALIRDERGVRLARDPEEAD